MTSKNQYLPVESIDWCYPEGPGIVKSYDFPLSSGTYDSNGGNKLASHIRRSVELPIGWEPINNAQIIAAVRDLQRKIEQIEGDQRDLAQEIEQLEKDKIVEFKNNDIYEVNKRIERLEVKVALINSNFAKNWIVRFFLGGLRL